MTVLSGTIAGVQVNALDLSLVVDFAHLRRAFPLCSDRTGALPARCAKRARVGVRQDRRSRALQ